MELIHIYWFCVEEIHLTDIVHPRWKIKCTILIVERKHTDLKKIKVLTKKSLQAWDVVIINIRSQFCKILLDLEKSKSNVSTLIWKIKTNQLRCSVYVNFFEVLKTVEMLQYLSYHHECLLDLHEKCIVFLRLEGWQWLLIRYVQFSHSWSRPERTSRRQS